MAAAPRRINGRLMIEQFNIFPKLVSTVVKVLLPLAVALSSMGRAFAAIGVGVTSAAQGGSSHRAILRG